MQLEKRPSPFYIDNERPFAQRTDGMSLDIIHPKDIPRGKIPFIKDEDRSLKTQDIDRCQPHYPHLNYLNKPDYSVGSTDPDHHGGRARTYYAPMDRRPRDLSLTTADIEYAQAKASKFKGNRHTDPVCPNYELPSCHVRPITPPRWNGRHLHDISDIEKSSSKVRIPTRNYVRDPNDSSDIEYASANYQERVHRRSRAGKADITMNVKDINQTKPLHYAPRCTNPLEPEYKVSTTATTSLHTKYSEEMSRSDVQLHRKEAEIHGHVPGSKPRKLQWDNGEPQFSLVREDIAGTVPQRWIGAVPINIYDPPEVKEVISFHDVHDIPGAQVGTLKKGIEGSRRAGTTNPLNPRYKMLDGDVRPQPVPVFDAERNVPMHSLVQSRAQASSLPNLRSMQVGTPVGSVPPSQRGMQRDASEGMLRRRDSPAGSQRGGLPQQSYQQAGRAPSGAGTPARAPSMPGTPANYRDVPTLRRQPSGGGMPQVPNIQVGGMPPSGRGGTPAGMVPSSRGRTPTGAPPGYTLPPGRYREPESGRSGAQRPPSGPSGNYEQSMPPQQYGSPAGYDTYGPPGGGQNYEPQQYSPQAYAPQAQEYYGEPSPSSGQYGVPDGYVPEGYIP